MNKIEFKDLEFPSLEENAKDILFDKWVNDAKEIPLSNATTWLRYFFINCNQISKELAQAENQKVEFTKDDIIKVFEAVGFVYYAENCYHIDTDILTLVLNLKENCLCFHIEGNVDGGYSSTESFNIDYNNIESIKFYYKQFCEMFNFELSKVEND